MSFVKFLSSKVFFKQLALAIVASIVLSFFVLKWLNVTTNHGEFVVVPNLKGKSIETVKIELADLDLTMKIQDSANFNPNYPKYSVIEQNPLAGAQVKENRKIYLILNPSGYRKVEVPDILKRTFRQAKPQLEAIGFPTTCRPRIHGRSLTFRSETRITATSFRSFGRLSDLPTRDARRVLRLMCVEGLLFRHDGRWQLYSTPLP